MYPNHILFGGILANKARSEEMTPILAVHFGPE